MRISDENAVAKESCRQTTPIVRLVQPLDRRNAARNS